MTGPLTNVYLASTMWSGTTQDLSTRTLQVLRGLRALGVHTMTAHDEQEGLWANSCWGTLLGDAAPRNMQCLEAGSSVKQGGKGWGRSGKQAALFKVPNAHLCSQLYSANSQKQRNPRR